MQLIPLSTSRLSQHKEMTRFKAKLVARIDANIAHLSGGPNAAKLSKGKRLYRMTEVLGEVELPTLVPSAPLIFSVVPGEGESIEAAITAALTELRGSVLGARFDVQLLEGPRH